MQTLGIPYRDLRILDPLVPMPYPTAIFIREKALVVNLETIKMIICKDQVCVCRERGGGSAVRELRSPCLVLAIDFQVRDFRGAVNEWRRDALPAQ